MKQLIALFAVTGLVGAQSLTLSASKTAVRPGDSVILIYTLGGQTNPSIAALQWDEVDAAQFTVSTKALAVASASAKTLICETVPANRCILYGQNRNVIANGVVMTATGSVPTNATGTQITVSLTAPVAADGTGTTVALSAGPNLVLTLLSPADLNGDGKVDASDVQLSLNQALGLSSCTGDVNGDGVCNVKDTMIVIAAMLSALGQ